jgi:hypothetical protein
MTTPRAEAEQRQRGERQDKYPVRDDYFRATAIAEYAQGHPSPWLVVVVNALDCGQWLGLVVVGKGPWTSCGGSFEIEGTEV